VAVNSWDFGFNFVAKNSVTPTVTKINQGMDKLTKTTDKGSDSLDKFFFAWNSGMSLFRTGMGIINKLAIPVQEFAEFEHAIAAVGAISQSSAEDLKKLEAAALEAGLKTQFSPTEAAQGLQVLASAGLDAEDSIKTLLPVLDLAAASMGELGTPEAASAIIGTLKSFGKGMDEAAGVTDRLMKITTMTNFRTRDFGAGLSKAAANAGTFGFSLNDTLITMGLLRNTGEQATRASTALGEAMRRLATDGSALNKMNKQGISVYDKQTGAIRPFLDIMNDMVVATADMTQKQRNQFVESTLGARGLKVFNAVAKGSFKTMKDGQKVMASGAEMIAAMRGELDQATGTTENFRKRMQDTVKGQLILLKGSWQTLKILIGKSIGEAFRPIVEIAIKAINGVISLFTTMPGPIRVVVGLITKFIAVMSVLVAGMIAYKGAAIAVKAVNTLLASSFMGLNISLGPLLWGVAAVVAAILALKLAYDKNFLGFRDGLDSFIKGFKEGFKVLGLIIDVFVAGLTKVGEMLSPLINLWNSLWGSVNDVGDGAGLTMMEKIGKVVGITTGILAAFIAISLATKTAMIALKVGAMIFKGASLIMAGANAILTTSFTVLSVPLLPLIAAIAAVAAAFLLLKRAYDTNFLGFADGLRSFLTWVGDAFGTMVDVVTESIHTLLIPFKVVFGGIKTIVVGTMNVISTVVDFVVGGIRKNIERIYGWIKAAIDKAMWAKNKVKSLLGRGKSAVKKAVGSIRESLLGPTKVIGVGPDVFSPELIKTIAKEETAEMPTPEKLQKDEKGAIAKSEEQSIAAQIQRPIPREGEGDRIIEKREVEATTNLILDSKVIAQVVQQYNDRNFENKLTTTIPVAGTS